MPGILGLPIVVTVHDLAWHEVQAHAPAYARYYFGRFSLQQYRKAASIVVDSDFSRKALLRLLSDFEAARVHVVYPGVAADFCGIVRRDGDGRTILVVGTVERRKNLEVLVRATCAVTGGAHRRDWAAYAVRASLRAARAATWALRTAWRCPAMSLAIGSCRSTSAAPLRRCHRSTKDSVTLRHRRSAPACRASFQIEARSRKSLAATRGSSTPRIASAGLRRSTAALKGGSTHVRPAHGPRYRALFVGDKRAAYRARLCVVNRSVSQARPVRRSHRRARRQGAAEGSSLLRAS